VSSPLRGKRLFITGGTGFIGSLVLKALKKSFSEAKSGTSVVVLSRNPEAFQKSRPELLWTGLSFLEGDIASFRFNRESEFDFVLHGGNPASAPGDENEATEFWRTVVEGTEHLLSEIDRLVKKPQKIVLLSSGAVYARPFPEPGTVVETFPSVASVKKPTTVSAAYGEAKLATENALTGFAVRHGMGLSVARIFACAGAYLPLEGRFALGQFIRMARDSGEIVIRSDGSPLRSYLAGDELAEWVLTLLSGKAEGVEVFNLGSDDAVSIREVAETVQDRFAAHGKRVTIRFEPAPAETVSALSRDYVPGIEKIALAYGLKPRKSSIQAVEETTDWVLNETRSLP